MPPMKAGIAILVVALGAVIVQPLGVGAVGPDPNLKARIYSANLVQAMDQSTLSITNVGGGAACAPSKPPAARAPLPPGRATIRNRHGGSQGKNSFNSPTAAA